MTDYRWSGHEHEELHKWINAGPGVKVSDEVARGWDDLAKALETIDTDLQNALQKMGASWEGSTADVTKNALSPLAQWAGDANTGATVMKSSAELQGEYIADARKKMPDPVKVTTEKPDGWDYAKGALLGGFGVGSVVAQQIDHERQEAARENAHQEAIKVMEDYQSNSEWNANTLGEFQEPPQVVIDTPPPAGTTDPNANVGYSTGKNTGFTSGNDTTTPSWTPPPSGPPVTQLGTVTDIGTTKTSWVEPPKQPPTNLPPTLPPPIDTGNNQGQNKGGGGGTLPPVFTRPDGTGTGRGGAGKPGMGGMGGKAFGSMSGALGSGMKGAAGMTPGGMAGIADDGHVNRGAAGAGAAGKGGAAGAMGAGAAAGRGQGQGDEDSEHKVADYLVETDDVFGDERLVAPPVIGGAPEA